MLRSSSNGSTTWRNAIAVEHAMIEMTTSIAQETRSTEQSKSNKTRLLKQERRIKRYFLSSISSSRRREAGRHSRKPSFHIAEISVESGSYIIVNRNARGPIKDLFVFVILGLQERDTARWEAGGSSSGGERRVNCRRE